MSHVESTPLPPPPAAGTWQEAALPLYGLVIWHARKLARACGLPAAELDDAVGEALVNLCVSARNAFGRGGRALRCRYFAQNGVAAVLHTRRGRPFRQLDAAAGAALASRGPGPDEEAEAAELLETLLARLPGGRVRQAVRLKAEGLSTAEAAAAMGCCRQRVEQLLLRARALLLVR
jgi:DNA-directed RNA polymerase specialized sigma24 family protein